MRKLAAWTLLLEGCTAGLSLHGAARGALPPDVVIATHADAQAFAQDAPFIFAGQTLTVDSGFATDRPIELQSLAPVIVGTGVQFELNGVVAAGTVPMGAPLEKRGIGTLALTGANVYTSNTVLREGMLRLAGGSPLGSATYGLEQHAGTVLRLEPGTRVLNLVQLSASRPGDTPLPGLADRVEWQVESGQATLANNVNALVPIRKTGQGSLRLAGTVQSRSLVEVLGGALVVDGTVTSRVDVGRGARLEGRGEMAGARIGAGGMVAPGGRDAAGTLSAWGSVVFEPGSVYHVNAYADGQADQLQLYGDAQLDGDVWAQAGAGDWAPERRYLILAADRGIGASRFEGVDTNLVFLDPSLDYDAHNVYLTLRRNDLDLGDVGETPEDEDVGEVIDPPTPPDPPEPPVRPQDPEPPRPIEPDPPAGPAPQPQPEPEPELEPEPQPEPQPDPPPLPAEPDPLPVPETSAPAPTLRDTVLDMTHDQARSALRQLNGSWHASVRSFVVGQSRYVREAVLDSAPWKAEEGLDGWSSRAADAVGTEPALRAGDSGNVPRAGSMDRPRTWTQAYTAAGRRHATTGVSGDRHGSRGLVLGIDAPAGSHWRLGGVLAVQHARLERDGVPADASIDTLVAGVSGHGESRRLRLTVGLLHAWHRIDSRRHVSAGPLQEVLGASYTGRGLQAFLELMPRLRALVDWGGRLRGAGLQPYVRYAGTWLHVPEFDESGGVAAHHVHASHTRSHTATLGWRWQRQMSLDGRPLRVEADLGWRRALGGTDVISAQQFREGSGARLSAPFSSAGQPLVRNAFAFGLGTSAAPARNVVVSARYAGLYAAGYRDHAGWVDFRWRF